MIGVVSGRPASPVGRAVAIIICGLLSGCQPITSVDDPPTKAVVSLSVASGAYGAATQGPRQTTSFLTRAADLIQTSGADTLVLTRVAVVIRKVELKRQFVPGCPVDGPGVDGCHEFRGGPFLLELPLEGQVSTLISIDVPPGTYDEVEFEIHKPDDDTPVDQAFLDTHPEFEDVSIRVEGRFNGQPFVFVQDLNEKQELDLVPHLVIDESPMATNVTLTIAVSTWFVDGAGNLIDPRTANKGGDNEDLVEDNIERSIDAFEDRDRNGWRD